MHLHDGIWSTKTIQEVGFVLLALGGWKEVIKSHVQALIARDFTVAKMSDSSSCAGVKHEVESELLDILRVSEAFSYTIPSFSVLSLQL